MGTKAKELRPITEQGAKHDPHCRACGAPTPKGYISASDLWVFVLAQPTPCSAFRTTTPG